MSGSNRASAELRELRARVQTLEQLLDVYESSVIEQSDKLLDEQAVLRVQTTLLASLGEATPDGMVSTSVDGRILFANKQIAEMWGIELPVVGTETHEQTLHAMAQHCTDPTAFLDGVPTCITTGVSETEVPLSDGRIFEQYTAPVRSSDGELLGRVWRFRDITAAREIDRMKNEFISAVSHELRTPLTSIRASLDLITSGVMGEISGEGMSLAKVALNNCRRLVGLINDILDIEKIDAGRVEFRSEPLGLESVLEDAIESMHPYGRELDVEFRLDCDAAGALVRGDADRLTQVIENLLSNAAKFSPAGESVDVTLERRENTLRVTVADRGPGIPMHVRDRLFERFAEINSPGVRKQEGTGLGLSIARAIVEHHGGSIGCEPDSGEGSRFFFELPEISP